MSNNIVERIKEKIITKDTVALRQLQCESITIIGINKENYLIFYEMWKELEISVYIVQYTQCNYLAHLKKNRKKSFL